jgi:hypothetical protein
MKADTRARSLPALSAGLWEWEYGLGGGLIIEIPLAVAD